jgi:hypothetical protein
MAHPAQRPTVAKLVEVLRPLAEAEQSPQRLLAMLANSNLQGSWAKRELYTYVRPDLPIAWLYSAHSKPLLRLGRASSLAVTTEREE